MMEIKKRLLEIVVLANDYCSTIERAREMEKNEFIAAVLTHLPKLYLEFSDICADEASSPQEAYLPAYMDEDYYDNIRRRVETLMGADDTYLETFEEDMKYSDTPIGASVSESLTDIFQDLYNFVAAVRESDGELLDEAYRECRDNFVQYWGQTLCNVMRPLHHLRYDASFDNQ